MQEVAQLFDEFRGKTLTRAGVERALECYVIMKIGIGFADMKQAEAGAAMDMMCPACLTPRTPEKPRCLFCKSSKDAVHTTQPIAKRNEKLRVKEEEDRGEGQKVFHPGAVQRCYVNWTWTTSGSA